jgi:hypothetical protein
LRASAPATSSGLGLAFDCSSATDATIIPERAVAALERLGLEERRLHRMQAAVLRQSLDRDDLLARASESGVWQEVVACPSSEDGARAALPLAAAVLRSRQVEAGCRRTRGAAPRPARRPAAACR